jgi:hypothetical protein
VGAHYQIAALIPARDRSSRTAERSRNPPGSIFLGAGAVGRDGTRVAGSMLAFVGAHR